MANLIRGAKMKKLLGLLLCFLPSLAFAGNRAIYNEVKADNAYEVRSGSTVWTDDLTLYPSSRTYVVRAYVDGKNGEVFGFKLRVSSMMVFSDGSILTTDPTIRLNQLQIDTTTIHIRIVNLESNTTNYADQYKVLLSTSSLDYRVISLEVNTTNYADQYKVLLSTANLQLQITSNKNEIDQIYLSTYSLHLRIVNLESSTTNYADQYKVLLSTKDLQYAIDSLNAGATNYLGLNTARSSWTFVGEQEWRGQVNGPAVFSGTGTFKGNAQVVNNLDVGQSFTAKYGAFTSSHTTGSLAIVFVSSDNVPGCAVHWSTVTVKVPSSITVTASHIFSNDVSGSVAVVVSTGDTVAGAWVIVSTGAYMSSATEYHSGLEQWTGSKAIPSGKLLKFYVGGVPATVQSITYQLDYVK